MSVLLFITVYYIIIYFYLYYHHSSVIIGILIICLSVNRLYTTSITTNIHHNNTIALAVLFQCISAPIFVSSTTTINSVEATFKVLNLDARMSRTKRLKLVYRKSVHDDCSKKKKNCDSVSMRYIRTCWYTSCTV